MTLKPHVIFALATLLAMTFACSDDDDPSSTGDTSGTTDTSSDTTGSGDPGSLLAVSMTSTVGVLLDEVPESARTRVADDLLAKPESFWIERAKRQIDYTSYRLIFRNLYFEPEEGKGILPLPPVEIWNVVLNGSPEARTVDGHQVIAVDYTFTSTLLGPEFDAVNADARLTEAGKFVDEAFILPIDPEHIFERTGYACMNEADFPPNSVDTENARLFYDPECEAFAMVEDDGCHLSSPVPTQSCVEAIEAHVGKVETSVRFERLAWNQATADAVRVGQQIPGIAELRAMPEGVADNRIVYRYFAESSCAIVEGCVGGPGWRRLLQFTATVQNLGAVDAALGDVSEGSAPVENRLVSLSPCHNHMHFNHYGKFTFGSGDQQLGSKRAFCLESTWRYYNNEDTPYNHPYTCHYQGTAAGWGDDYIAGLDCQWVDITTVDTTAAPVVDTLGFHVNPDKFLCEGTTKVDEAGMTMFEPTEFKNEAGETESRIACEEVDGAADNNHATADVTIPTNNGGLVTEPCGRGQFGPVRNCGFTSAGAALTCTPGEPASITCTGASADKPVAVRICEASEQLGAIPCTYNDAIAVGTHIGDSLKLDFTCPAARSAAIAENGGRIGIYTAPIVPGDETSVTCAWTE